jgi:sugar phosphate isomerase/epimerase
VRERLAQDYESTLRQVSDIGYAGVEPFGDPANLREQAALIADLGLAVPSAHVSFPDTDENREAALRSADAYGTKRIIASVMPEGWATRDTVERTIEAINEASAFAQKNGLTIGYHNHWWEYEAVDGILPYKLLLNRADPALIFQIDIYWVQTAGLDPARVVAEHGERATVLHVKDGPADSGESDMVAVGAGTVDVQAAVEAADHADWLIVELDRCATDMMTAVWESYEYMTREGLARGRAG